MACQYDVTHHFELPVFLKAVIFGKSLSYRVVEGYQEHLMDL